MSKSKKLSKNEFDVEWENKFNLQQKEAEEMFNRYVKKKIKIYGEDIYDEDHDKIGEIDTICYASGYCVKRIIIDFNSSNKNNRIVIYKKYKV